MRILILISQISISHSLFFCFISVRFSKTNVYQKAKQFNKDVSGIIKSKSLDRTTKDQLRRAAFSIVLNIAEGSSRFSNKDRKNFFLFPEVVHLSVLQSLNIYKIG